MVETPRLHNTGVQDDVRRMFSGEFQASDLARATKTSWNDIQELLAYMVRTGELETFQVNSPWPFYRNANHQDNGRAK